MPTSPAPTTDPIPIPAFAPVDSDAEDAGGTVSDGAGVCDVVLWNGLDIVDDEEGIEVLVELEWREELEETTGGVVVEVLLDSRTVDVVVGAGGG